MCVCVGAGSASLPSPRWLAFDASYLIIPRSHANEAKDHGCDGWTGGVRGGAVGARCSVSLALLTHTHIQTCHQEHHKWEGQLTQLSLVEHSGSHCHKWVSCSWLIGWLCLRFYVVVWSRTDRRTADFTGLVLRYVLCSSEISMGNWATLFNL